MTLDTGTKLGPNEILGPIGAGGMDGCEVYKAKDTRLERVVAVKVLPSHLASLAPKFVSASSRRPALSRA